MYVRNVRKRIAKQKVSKNQKITEQTKKSIISDDATVTAPIAAGRGGGGPSSSKAGRKRGGDGSAGAGEFSSSSAFYGAAGVGLSSPHPQHDMPVLSLFFALFSLQ